MIIVARWPPQASRSREKLQVRPVLVDADAARGLGAGRLHLAGVAEPGGEPLERVSWTVYGTEPDDLGRYPQVASSGADQWTATLPAGSYRIETSGGGRSGSAEVELGAGEVRELEVVMEGG